MERKEDSTTEEAALRLLLILAGRIVWFCDNVGGEPREECRCDACEGSRLAEKLRHDLDLKRHLSLNAPKSSGGSEYAPKRGIEL